VLVVKVYWLSRHEPLPSQVAELRRLFGEDVVIEQDPKPFDSVDDILNRFRQSGADELLVVAPLSVIAQLVQRGVKPLWAEMEQVTDPCACGDGSGRAALPLRPLSANCGDRNQV
jgi:hypothetical protein